MGLVGRPVAGLQGDAAGALTHTLVLMLSFASPLPKVAAALALLLPLTASAQRGASDSTVSAPVTAMRYEVRADREALEGRRLHVTTTFDVSSGATVLLSLPAWTPGAYELDDFARWISGFSVTQGGALLRWDKLDFDTWRLRPTRSGTVTVEFDYEADSLDNAMSWTRPDFALFNGTNLFLYPEGRPLDFPATVTVRTDSDLRIATGMPRGSAGRGSYRSDNYHDLVDMPFFVGLFDLDSATISGRTVRYATYPRGSVSREARATAWEQLRRIIPVEANVFGEVPWTTYDIMQIADSSYGGYSGLEHANSHVDIVAPGFIGSVFQPSLYAHEIFHAWNVKRLRPADLVPYHYDRRQPSPWLWMSEGVTDYYADLAQVRGGTVDAAGFYALTSAKIAEIEQTIPFALEDASVNAWIHPKDGTEQSYYPKGSLAGLMLDIIIRDASDGKRSLDGVMRELYQTTYKKGRGFGAADFWGAVSRAAGGRSFDDFHARYVDGREPYPWPETLRTIGLRLQPDSAPRLGVLSVADSTGGVRVSGLTPGAAGARAGLRVGDQLVSIGDVRVTNNFFADEFRAVYGRRAAGSALPIVVKRDGATLTLPGTLAFASTASRIADDPAAPARAVRLRNGILRGTTER
jgi:predicted metalloprotease with PDZ domain